MPKSYIEKYFRLKDKLADPQTQNYTELYLSLSSIKKGTIMFADIKGYTNLTAQSILQDIVNLLRDLY